MIQLIAWFIREDLDLLSLDACCRFTHDSLTPFWSFRYKSHQVASFQQFSLGSFAGLLTPASYDQRVRQVSIQNGIHPEKMLFFYSNFFSHFYMSQQYVEEAFMCTIGCWKKDVRMKELCPILYGNSLDSQNHFDLQVLERHLRQTQIEKMKQCLCCPLVVCLRISEGITYMMDNWDL